MLSSHAQPHSQPRSRRLSLALVASSLSPPSPSPASTPLRRPPYPSPVLPPLHRPRAVAPVKTAFFTFQRWIRSAAARSATPAAAARPGQRQLPDVQLLLPDTWSLRDCCWARGCSRRDCALGGAGPLASAAGRRCQNREGAKKKSSAAGRRRCHEEEEPWSFLIWCLPDLDGYRV